MTERAAVMVPAPAAGHGRTVVRRRRLTVEDGALVLTTGRGARQVLAAPGDITAATWVPQVADRPQAVVRETLELARRGAPPLALPLDDWLGADHRAVPRQPDGRAVPPLGASGSLGLRLSGGEAVLAALGLRAESGRALAAGAQLVPAAGRLSRRGKVLLHAWIPVALLLLGLGVSGADVGLLLLLLPITLGVLVLLSVVTTLVLDLRQERELEQAELPGRAWHPQPTVPQSRTHVRTAVLRFSPEWLVVRDAYGREGWTPGPELGGARVAHVRGSWLAFEDEHAVALQRLWWPGWGGVARLAEVLRALAATGYEVRGSDEEPTGALWRPPPSVADEIAWDRDGTPPSPYLAATLAPFLLLLLGTAAGEEAFTPLGVLVLAPPALAVLVALIALGRGVRRARLRRLLSPAELESDERRHRHRGTAPSG